MSKFTDYLSNPNKFLIWILRYTNRFWPDKIYLRMIYFIYYGKTLNLHSPKLFTEKLQWLKLFYHNPYYSSLVDKIEMKKVVGELIGNQYVVPYCGVWEDFDSIDFNDLPDQFVLKCTHDSASYVICKDKSKLDIKRARKKIEKGLNKNYYYQWREWPYKNVSPKIIAENLLVDESNDTLIDYKFFCFHGQPVIMYISNDAGDNPHTDFFDMEFNKLNIRMRDPNSNKIIKKPDCFDEMKSLAVKLCKDMPHARIDFYYVKGIIYVGEITFYHNSGFFNINPSEWDEILGNLIDLDKCKKDIYYCNY